MRVRAVAHACPPPRGQSTGKGAERGKRRGEGESCSFPRKDLANVCRGSLRVGEETSMLCIFETSLGGVGRW